VTWPTLGQLWTFLGVFLPALAALLVPMPAVDLAYQLRAGADILAGHGIPDHDTWTFTVTGAPWLDQQWGAQVLLSGVFQVLSWTGLAVWVIGIVYPEETVGADGLPGFSSTNQFPSRNVRGRIANVASL